MTRTLTWDRGTLLLEGFPREEIPAGFVDDPRVNLPRGPASLYYQVVRELHARKIPWKDEARAYAPLDRPHLTHRTPRDYQADAVKAWDRGGRRGCVVLPTGAGKSFVAELCIAVANRATLVVAPTIDLVGQWYDHLRRAFGEPVGVLGGGVHEVHPITVSTYDSAYLNVERYGNRFGLVVFDEVHHLPSASYGSAAELCLAPWRLGLSATIERPDGLHNRLDELVGPVVYRQEITDLAGEFLAPYQTEVITVELSPEDRARHDALRAQFRAFVQENNIPLGHPQGWGFFLRAAVRSQKGRAALDAWRDSRRILHGARQKLEFVAELLHRHVDNRVIVFTNDNATVYEISRRLLVPAITHHTDLKERRALLAAFADGTLPVLVTSRVLNEGVDIPSADVAIVLSGTNTVREHVQRLGRILRPQAGKQAILYELVVAGTSEERTSERRRSHAAYRQGEDGPVDDGE
jgi:superfamily II DNA or RNA helicase